MMRHFGSHDMGEGGSNVMIAGSLYHVIKTPLGGILFSVRI